MAPQKQNSLMHWVQIFLTAIVIPFAFSIQHDITEIKIQMATLLNEQKNDHAIVSELRLKTLDHETQGQNHENRLSKIEAILPELLRKKLTNF